MDAMEDARNWGDPYIGLRLAAEQCQGFISIAVDTPRQALAGVGSALGSPGVFEDIARFLDSLLYWVRPYNFFPFVYSITVKPALEWLKNELWAKIQRFAMDEIVIIQNWLAGLYNPFKQALVDGFNAIKSPAIAIRDWLSGTFGPWIAAAKDAIVGAYVWLSQTFGPAVAAVQGAIVAAYSWLRDTLASTLAAIKEAIAGAYAWLSTTFNSAIAAIRTALEGAYTWLKTTLTTLWTTIKEAVVNSYLWLRDVAAPFLGNLPTLIWQGLQGWWNSVVSGFAAWWAAFLETIHLGADRVIATVGPLVRKWAGEFASIPATFLNWVAVTAGTNLALQPSRALATAGSLYVMSMAAGSAAHILSTALNAIPTTSWVGASQLSAYIAEAAAFLPLTQATYGVLLNDCLTWPLRYHWNQQLRPRVPTEGEIFSMGRKRGLTRSEFGQAMAYQGLPDWWIDKIYQFFWTDPSPMWLLRMSEVSNPEIRPSSTFLPWLQQWLPNWRSDPWAWYKMKLMLAGFEDTDIPAFIDGFQRRMVATAVTQVKTSVRAMVRDAYWDRADVQSALRPLGVRQDEIEYIMLAEEIDYQHGYLGDQVTSLLESFRKGKVSRQDLRLALSTIIVKPERVAQLVAREEVRALPAPKAVAPAKEDPLVKTLVTQAVSSWTGAYRKWQITAEDLELGLSILLRDPARAALMVNVERARYRPVPPVPPPAPEDPIVASSRRAAIASWVTQYREGKITADVMELGLSPLVADAQRVKQIRQLEELRAVPAPAIVPPWEEDPLLAQVREESVRGHLEMFRKRQISLGELYSYLVADGLAEALARATCLTQAFKRISTPPVEAPYFQQDQLRAAIDDAIAGYTRMLEQRQITLPEFLAYLLAAGVDPDVAQYLTDTQEVRAFLRT